MAQNKYNKLLGFINNPLVVGLFFSLYSILMRFFIFQKYESFLVTDSLLIQSFIEWFGVAYGLFIALVLVNVWSQFDVTEREFDKEADAILMLYEATKQVKERQTGEEEEIVGDIKNEIIMGIKAYTTHVIKYYLVEHNKLKIRDEGDKILDSVRDAIGKLVHTSETTAIKSELVRGFNEAVDLRGDRISHSKQRIPNPVWGIALASSVLWVAPFYALNFAYDLIAILLEGGVTAIVVAILVIIKDLDDPFEGSWKINIREWELLGERINVKPTLIFVYSFESSRIYKLLAFLNSLLSKRLCALYSLLSDAQQQENFISELENSVYLQFYFYDEFKSLYEELESLPVIIYKSGYTMKPLIEKADINNINKLDDLKGLIIKKPVKFFLNCSTILEY